MGLRDIQNGMQNGPRANRARPAHVISSTFSVRLEAGESGQFSPASSIISLRRSSIRSRTTPSIRAPRISILSFWSELSVGKRGCHASRSFFSSAPRSAKLSARRRRILNGSTSCSCRRSANAANLFCRPADLDLIASSRAGQYFSCSGVSCNAAFTRAILRSVKCARSV